MNTQHEDQKGCKYFILIGLPVIFIYGDVPITFEKLYDAVLHAYVIAKSQYI